MRVRRSLYSALFIVFGLSLPAAANDLKVCFSSGAHDVIVAACTRAIDSGDARGRDAAIAYNQRGLAYENVGNHDAAIADFSAAIRLNPRYATAFNNRSWAYNNKGEFDLAVRDSTEAIRIDPKYATAYVNRGVSYEQKGEYDKAIADYSEAIKLNPKFAGAYNNRGVCYSTKGEFNLAIRDYDNAIRLSPKEVSSYYNRGIAYERKGDLERALANYRAVLQLRPDNQSAAAAILQIEQRRQEEPGSDLAVIPAPPKGDGSHKSEPAPVDVGRRVALVVGNGTYKSVARLTNPTRDATAIAALFKAAGFEIVQLHQDLDLASLRRAIRDFSEVARDADIAVLFFAGHGIEMNGANYLIPVDARIERDTDVEDEAVSLDRVIQLLEPAKRLRLVILDACRDNVFVTSMKRTLASRSIGRGLARVEPAASDTLIAFAARAGSTADDGRGSNSPYTTALLNHLATPGLDLRLALGRVRDEVLTNTGRRQEPFLYGSLGGAEIPLVARKRTPTR